MTEIVARAARPTNPAKNCRIDAQAQYILNGGTAAVWQLYNDRKTKGRDSLLWHKNTSHDISNIEEGCVHSILHTCPHTQLWVFLQKIDSRHAQHTVYYSLKNSLYTLHGYYGVIGPEYYMKYEESGGFWVSGVVTNGEAEIL